MSKAARGSCLCGAIKLRAEQCQTKLGACHCTTCQKWGGGPLLAVDCGVDVTVEGLEHLGLYSSSEWAERGFCKQCGSSIFYRLKQTGQHIVSVAIFDDLAQIEFTHQVFIDEKPIYYDFANQTHNMTGAEVFAQFANTE